MECKEVRAKIYSMFTFNFSPSNVDALRAKLNAHLLECPECREYLHEMFERKNKEVAE